MAEAVKEETGSAYGGKARADGSVRADGRAGGRSRRHR